jgi:hypothetical protein
MRILNGLCVILFSGGILLAQTHRGTTAGFGNVVFPGGGTQPGVQRSFGNVVFPGAGLGSTVGIPFSITDPTFGARLGANIGGRNVLRQSGGFRRGTTVLPYAYPVYIGGGDYGTSYDQPVQQQPNITVIYPPQQQPVIINQFGADQGQAAAAAAPTRDTVSLYQSPVTSGDNPAGQSMNEQPSGYLIALKDHTIYSAVAYWVDGDTLHYFTSGNNHNQVSLTLVDRELTDRLNREKGTEVRLPR